MTDEQTEARAIVGDYLDLSDPRHEQLCRLVATALAAKDAELADLQSRYNKALVDIDAKDYRAERAEAQLASASKDMEEVIRT